MNAIWACIVLLVVGVAAAWAGEPTSSPGEFDVARVPAPMFRDPIFDGAADPTVVWNAAGREWWVFYTQRRANVACPGVSWCFGSKIGIGSSGDVGRTWVYRGTAQGLSVNGEEDTWWAPAVVQGGDGTFHMFVAYIRGIYTRWGAPEHVYHFTSADLKNWKNEGLIDLGSDRVIDPGVARFDDGAWRMFFKDEAKGSRTFVAESPDLFKWTRVEGRRIGDRSHEAPVPFKWKGAWWLLTDEWRGLGAWKSADGKAWERNGLILDKPGARRDDGTIGQHPDVVVLGDRAVLFYFTHPGRRPGVKPPLDEAGDEGYATKRTSLQAAELEMVDGKLVCDRDKYAKKPVTTRAAASP